MPTNSNENDRVTAEAVEWVQRLDVTRGAEIEDQWAEWTEKSPLHLPEFLIQRQIEMGMQHIRAQHAAMPIVLMPVAATAPKRSNWVGWGSLAACLALLTPTLIALWMWRTTPPQMHSTGSTGEDVVLADGTRVNIYPDTEMSARNLSRYSKITVDRGGARFRLTHRLLQRFQVRAGAALITATGTAFNVLRANGNTGVYVVEGSVQVEGSFRQRKTLAAGESTTVSADGVIGNVLPPIPESEFGPRDFEDETIEQLALEVNRQNMPPRVVVMDAIGKRRFLKITGIEGPESLIQKLGAYPDIKIERQGNVVKISSAAAPASATQRPESAVQ